MDPLLSPEGYRQSANKRLDVAAKLLLSGNERAAHLAFTHAFKLLELAINKEGTVNKEGTTGNA